VPRGIPLASLSDRVGQQLAERLRVVGAIPPRIEVELVSALDRSGGRMGKLKLVQFAPAPVARELPGAEKRSTGLLSSPPDS